MEQARQMLQHHFGYDTFRQGQAQIIEQTLRGQSSLCVMPTGGGKSICYQIPALMLEGVNHRNFASDFTDARSGGGFTYSEYSSSLYQ